MTDPKQARTGGAGSKPRQKQDNPETDQPAPERRAKWLSEGLRKLYDEDVGAPIPDSFVALLDQLERQEREKK